MAFETKIFLETQMSFFEKIWFSEDFPSKIYETPKIKIPKKF